MIFNLKNLVLYTHWNRVNILKCFGFLWSRGETTQKSPDKSRPFAPGADSIEKRKSGSAEQKNERLRVLEKKVYAFSLRNVQSKKFVFDLFVVRKDGSEMTETESSDKENLKRQKNKIERNVFNIGDEMKTCNKLLREKCRAYSGNKGFQTEVDPFHQKGSFCPRCRNTHDTSWIFSWVFCSTEPCTLRCTPGRVEDSPHIQQVQ